MQRFDNDISSLMSFRNLALFFALLCFSFPAKSQNVSLRCVLDKNEILIGDQLKYQVQLEFNPQQYRVQIPFLPDSFNKFQLVERKKTDTLKNEQTIRLTQDNIITHFDSGRWVIPSQKFIVTPLDGTSSYELLSDSFIVLVNAPAVDTSKPIKPIFDVIAADKSWWDAYKKYILSIVGILLLMVALVYYFRYRRKNQSKKIIAPISYVTPWDNALQKIESLCSKELWLNAQEKEHHTELTDIIRTYLEDGFKLDCFEKTSQEIITDVKKSLQQAKFKRRSEELDKLRQLFYIADLVKFAKSKPTMDEHVQSNEAAKSFVENTSMLLIAQEKIKKQAESIS